MGINKDEFSKILDTLSNSIDEDNISFFKELYSDRLLPDLGNPEDFHITAIYPHEMFIDGLLSHKLSNNNDVKFIYQNHNFIDNHFKKIIVKKEGRRCSADKSRTILNSLVRFYKDGDEIDFDYEQKYTFHLPKKEFTDHNSIVEFYEALKHLYYGNPEYYLPIVNKIN